MNLKTKLKKSALKKAKKALKLQILCFLWWMETKICKILMKKYWKKSKNLIISLLSTNQIALEKCKTLKTKFLYPL